MTKQKKEDTGELMVSLDQFTRTRDSVIVSLTNLQTGLTHVQNGLNDLLRSYMQHTASILGTSGDNLESLQLPPHIAAATAASSSAVAETAARIQSVLDGAPAQDVGGKRKRKREKKERDPNAPKRPLTAAFLYAQVARPIVKQDLEQALGPNEKLEPNAVNLEVNKRWNEMIEEEKEKWRASYRESMEQWKKDNAAYLASLGADVTMHEDEEASDEAEAGALDSDASSDDDEDAVANALAKAPSPPAGKTPKSKRQKTGTHVNGTNGPVAIAPAASTPVPLPSSGQAGAAGETTAAKKDKKKDRKAPQAIAPAPAAQKESSPEDTKKKPKSRSTRNTEAEDETVAAELPKGTKKRDRSKRKSEGASA